MTQQEQRAVVLALGHDPIDQALAFATAEAVRSGVPLHVVHVIPELPVGTDLGWGGWTVEADLLTAGRERLIEVSERAQELARGRFPVTTELARGRVVSGLVHAAKGAALIVLGHRDLSATTRLVTRSVSSGVAARARTPVVTVPCEWAPSESVDPSVTVGVKDPQTSAPVLRRACREALVRGARLTVVHTWSLDQPYGYVVPTKEEDGRLQHLSEQAIRSEILALGAQAASIPVTVVARHDRPADALVASSKEAALLVLGRHDPTLPLGSHLGPVVRAVLRSASCPVLLLDAVEEMSEP